MSELLGVEIDNRKTSQLNIEESKSNDVEIASLKAQIEQCEGEIAELKLDKGDLMAHMKMSQKIKKSKNPQEIANAQTLIFEVGSTAAKRNGAGRKK